MKKLLILALLTSSFAMAGTCKIKAQLWVKAPVILLSKHKVNLDDATLAECVEEAQEVLKLEKEVKVPICGGSDMSVNCGTINAIARVKKAKFKFIGDGHIVKGSVKKKRAKKNKKKDKK